MTAPTLGTAKRFMPSLTRSISGVNESPKKGKCLNCSSKLSAKFWTAGLSRTLLR